MHRPSRGTNPGRAGPGRFQTCSMVNRPACARPVTPHVSTSRPTMRLIVLDRCMALIWPTSVLPMAGNWLLTAFSTLACRAGELAATWTSTVTRISSSGNTDTKAENAMFAASTPPLSSPYFLITPKMNADTRCRCCAVSTRRITRSTGFMRTLLPGKVRPKLRTGGRSDPGTVHNRSQLGSGQRSPIRINLNARETGRDAAPAQGENGGCSAQGLLRLGTPGARLPWTTRVQARALADLHPQRRHLQGHHRPAAQAVRAPARHHGCEGGPRRGRGERQHGHRDRGHRPRGRDLVPGTRAGLGQPLDRPA